VNLDRKQALDYYAGGLGILLLRPVVFALGRLLRRDHTLRVDGEICIQKLLGGGSLVLAFPALLGLRRRHPDATLSLLCSRDVAPFAETLGVFDRIRIVDDSSLPRLLTSAFAAWRGCRRADTVVDFEVHSRLSTIFSVATGARNRVGFFLQDVFWRRGLHTHLIFFNRFSGSWHFYEKALELLGAEPAAMAECGAHVRAQLPPVPEGPPGRVCIGASCSELARERMLAPAHWRRVMAERAGEGEPRDFVFLGAAGDRAFADAVIAQAREAAPQHRYHNRCGELTLPESLAELAGAQEFWGVDSGLLHYARLFGLRCLSWWGPTDPATRLKPVPGLEEEVVYRKIPCSPCVHVAERPPCAGNNLCIKNLFEPPRPGEPEWLPRVDP
jgi:ADP-heptose:LPS heptosyltransferase